MAYFHNLYFVYESLCLHIYMYYHPQKHRERRGRRHLSISFDITTTMLWLITSVLSLSSTPTEVLSDHINDTYHYRIYMSLVSLRPSPDIEPNPGPIRHPCGICERPVAANHRAICCDSCDTWIHIKCANMSPKKYQKHQNSSCTWICFRCGMPTFSDSFFENSCNKSLQH